MTAKPLIFCAIDTADMNRAIELAKIIGPVTKGLKLGLEFFSTFGPAGVEKICNAAPDAALFLDLKFHDIPNTVASAIKIVTENLAPAYINVHASGGEDMMEAALKACAKPSKLLAVTILTSLSDEALDKIGYKEGTLQQAMHLAALAKDSGLAGVVCSPYEIETIRKKCGENFILMVPGIRPPGADSNDQHRFMTPAEALQKGATHLVIGRPITGARDPGRAAAEILKSL
jgi:orotidine-5'-phosphate decarboxylase